MKVLVANRGPSALRIVRACRELGLASVAVHTDPAGHALVEAARAHGADAVHPGCGGLAERASLAAAVAEAGLIWIGPPAEAVAAMASGASGGAQGAVRHIDVPVLADQHGGCIAVGTRDGSVRRLGGPVLVEAPGALPPEVSDALQAAAVEAALACGHTGAGVCQFHLGADGAVHRLGMRPGLQLEHAATELVTGWDLVAWQLRIAGGERLPERAPEPRGVALSCRVSAEDPADGFRRTSGRVEQLHTPSGPGVRWDGGIDVGSLVGPTSERVLALLSAQGPDRAAASARLRRALEELVIAGVETSRSLHLRVVPELQRGPVDTSWLEAQLPALLVQQAPPETVRAAAVAAALLADRDRAVRTGRADRGPRSDWARHGLLEAVRRT